ncbi:hypothetical protein QYE76_045247 [Lolium multiflorum]|uniref:Integrase catalytic domain-containing protein n=1 Tax=Lolium multiflorum TaxID=4521 RepID=A0AAD8TK45_LOLMU|nr:hypothetical protein QYE76_045247 [Lolium multiflorum]
MEQPRHSPTLAGKKMPKSPPSQLSAGEHSLHKEFSAKDHSQVQLFELGRSETRETLAAALNHGFDTIVGPYEPMSQPNPKRARMSDVHVGPERVVTTDETTAENKCTQGDQGVLQDGAAETCNSTTSSDSEYPASETMIEDMQVTQNSPEIMTLDEFLDLFYSETHPKDQFSGALQDDPSIDKDDNALTPESFPIAEDNDVALKFKFHSDLRSPQDNFESNGEKPSTDEWRRFLEIKGSSFAATANERVSAAAGESVVLGPNEREIGTAYVVAGEGSTRQIIPSGVALQHPRKPSITPSPDSDSIFVSTDPGAPQPNPGASQSKSGASQPNPPAPQPNPGASQPNPPAPQPNPATMQSNPEAPKMEALMVSVFEIKCVPSWAQEFLSYLTDGVLPNDRVQARQIERRDKAYTIINHQLYKRSVSGVFQRCVEPAEGIELLREIHQGECGHHASSRAIVGKAFRHGFYWPTVLRDAEELVRKCNGCQRFAKQRHTPASALKTIPITWPFAVWGLDMVGPFKTARGGMTHLLVMIDKFTKWIEAKPIKKLDGSTAVTFLKEIIVRYGYPHCIITDNGNNFAEGIFKRY